MQTVEAADYHDIATVSDPDVSPDGERVAFVRTEPDEEGYAATIHVARVGGESGRFTAEAGVDAEPRWSPSGDRLAFVSDRGEGDAPQLWVLPADGGEARRVTDVVGGAGDVAWSPDGGRIAFVQATTPEEREAGHDVGRNGEYEREKPDPRVIDDLVWRSDGSYRDGARGHVYVADLGDDSVERLTDGDVDHASPSWGDAETLYYAVRRRGDPDDNIEFDVDAHDVASGEAETLVETTGAPCVAATADGRLAYPYIPEDHAASRQVEVRVFDRESGETATLTESLDRTVSLAVSHLTVGLTWDPDGEYLYFVTPDGGDYVLRRAPGDASADPAVVTGDGHVDGVGVGADWIAVTKSEWDHPGDVFAVTPAGGEESRLTRINADYLDDRAVGEPEGVRFESDGHDLQGWLLTPPDFDPEGSYPLAVEVHGGPHVMWSTAGTMWHEFQTLAARGYVVFWSNPRGSTGYGEAHARAVERDWGGVTLADVLAGVETVAERGYVDAEQVFLTGGSFGGYLTAWAVGHTDRFAAAVAQRGVYDFASFYGSTDGAFKLVEWDFGTTPWEEPAFLWEQSPAAYADRVETPTLVMHSEDDFRVPVNNGELLYRFLKKNGVETRFVRYPEEGHELSRSGRPGHVVDRVERIARWFDGYSDHHDVPKATERGDDGLSNAGGEGDAGGEGETAGAADENVPDVERGE